MAAAQINYILLRSSLSRGFQKRIRLLKTLSFAVGTLTSVKRFAYLAVYTICLVNIIVFIITVVPYIYITT